MKVGYPCINRTIEVKGARTFRLRSYSERRLIETVANNLDCLAEILKFNIDHHILFFRISSDLVPFASHPICQFDWLKYFRDRLKSIGKFITLHNIRISMHPGQYAVLNSHDSEIVARSIEELQYHSSLLETMGLDMTAKIQIHVGGIYGNKDKSLGRFIDRYHILAEALKQRLVIENDDRSYTLDDCMRIYDETGAPILFDVFHHEMNHAGSSCRDALVKAMRTWQDRDGIPMVDYSHSQNGVGQIGHAYSIDVSHFECFLRQTEPYDFDVMLEIKDKETSAIKAVEIARKDTRFFNYQSVRA